MPPLLFLFTETYERGRFCVLMSIKSGRIKVFQKIFSGFFVKRAGEKRLFLQNAQNKNIYLSIMPKINRWEILLLTKR